MTEDEAVIALATRAGLEVQWTDAKGERRIVRLDTVRAVLKALDLPADTSADSSDSGERLSRDLSAIPPLQIARPGEDVRVGECRHTELVGPDGTRSVLRPRPTRAGEAAFRAPRQSGYYTIEYDGSIFGLAVVPARCLRPEDLAAGRKLAGTAVQIYSLRGGTTGTFGDFAALASFAKEAGRAGLDAIIVSPTHALFGGEPGRFSPYSPSTRLFLNPLFADVTLEGLPAEEESGDDLIDWRSAGPKKYQRLRAAFAQFRKQKNRSAFLKFCCKGGERLYMHALFEALDTKFRKQGIAGFDNWPDNFRQRDSAGATAYARSAPAEIEFQLFLQWLSARSADAAQKIARRSMAVGIIADIAVGMDPQGSHAWSAPDEVLSGLLVGAPPDIFNARGQDWGLTVFSPRSLRLSGYNSFIAMLRANMAYAGGARIDHALGLRRLWVLPSGASPADGVYLRYPQRELLGLTALESRLNGAIVIAEDLGTVPEGLSRELAVAGALGMQVLWFERDRSGNFVGPGRWRRDAAAMTTTHDLPTVAGWWSGHDIVLRDRLGWLPGLEELARSERAADRKRLWAAFRRAKCAKGFMPTPDEPDLAIAGALRFIGKSRCSLAIAPIEDIAGERDQPNMPGTIGQHPNWRRRMKQRKVIRERTARARLEAFVSARNGK